MYNIEFLCENIDHVQSTLDHCMKLQKELLLKKKIETNIRAGSGGNGPSNSVHINNMLVNMLAIQSSALENTVNTFEELKENFGVINNNIETISKNIRKMTNDGLLFGKSTFCENRGMVIQNSKQAKMIIKILHFKKTLYLTFIFLLRGTMISKKQSSKQFLFCFDDWLLFFLQKSKFLKFD